MRGMSPSAIQTTRCDVALGMERRFPLVLAASAVFMLSILLLDGRGLTQLALGLATTGFLFLVVRSSRIDPRQVVCCVAVATAGEIVLSLGWGLYHYQHAIIPLYVPPGHGLFYALAAMTAQQNVFRRHEGRLTWATVGFGTLVALNSLYRWNDVWGMLWWLAAVAIIWRTRNRLMISACFVYTILLEWVGTSLGNWFWVADVPLVGLRSANPPSGVGILYILLDLIVVAIGSAFITTPVAGLVTSAASQEALIEEAAAAA